jgi:RNA polymerase sigma factor (sigma-70 family)
VPSGPVGKLMRRLRTAALRAEEGPSDGQLLERFINGREEAAFEALVRRHAPLVFGVCRRVLGNVHDAEDAFQATFLVLFRKASSLGRRGRLGNWLYGVAYRTALAARAAGARRRKREALMAAPVPADATSEARQELLNLLDKEMSRLPDRYRTPLVLCELEGKTRKEAARLLGWPEGTVAGRLARARTLLARRLSRHGIGLAVGGLATLLAESIASPVVPAALTTTAVRAVTLTAAGKATGVVSTRVIVLAEGVLKTMLLEKLRIALLTVLVIALLAPGAGLLARWASLDGPRQDKPNPPSTTEKQGQPAPNDIPALGYRWVKEPQDGRGSPWAIGRRDGKGVVAIEEKDKDGALLLTLAHPAPTNRAGLVEFRPVAFDDQGNRHVLELIYGAGTGEVAMNRFRLDPKKLSAEKIKRLGVEMLTPEGLQLITREAVARAKKEGIEVLPPAQVGKQFDFVLTTLDGCKLRSQELRGKVVLLDCWSCT